MWSRTLYPSCSTPSPPLSIPINPVPSLMQPAEATKRSLRLPQGVVSDELVADAIAAGNGLVPLTTPDRGTLPVAVIVRGVSLTHKDRFLILSPTEYRLNHEAEG